MKRISKAVKRLAGATAIVAALGMAASGVATSAYAAEGNINTDTAVTLTIHKHAAPTASDSASTGKKLPAEQEGELGAALEGAGFTLTPVTAWINNGTSTSISPIKSTDDYAAAVKYLTDHATSAADQVALVKDATHYTLGTALAEQKTDANGVTTFSGLSQGLYLVEETTLPEGATQAAAPFVVSLPTANGDGTWTYDVHAYPKNQVDNKQTEKTLKTAPATPEAGAEFTWEISKTIPSTVTSVESLVMKDPLDSRLTYKSATVTLDGEALTADTDYTITTATREGTTATNVTIAFKDAGIAKIDAKAGADRVVKVELVTALSDAAATESSNVVPNSAAFKVGNDGSWNWSTKPPSPDTPDNPNPDNPNHPYNPPTTPNTPTTPDTPTVNYASFKLIKFAAGDETKLLSGAEFDVYATDATGAKTGDAVAHVKTGDDGTASLKLYVGANTDYTQDYVLVETRAPYGYTLDSTEHKITLTADPANTDTTITATNEVKISNTQTSVPSLPLTGAQGTLLLLGVGVVAIVIAVGLQVAARKRRHQDA